MTRFLKMFILSYTLFTILIIILGLDIGFVDTNDIGINSNFDDSNLFIKARIVVTNFFVLLGYSIQGFGFFNKILWALRIAGIIDLIFYLSEVFQNITPLT